jgi:hypothetical protein
LPTISSRDFNTTVTNVTINVINTSIQSSEDNMSLERTLAISIVIVIAITALILTMVLARCLMKQSSIGNQESQSEKGCKHRFLSWWKEYASNLPMFRDH